MRIAIVSDIHGNLTALEAVLADLREMSPDLVLHGGDLADLGSSPAEVVDRIRDLGWPGVAGNTDEMLFRPQSLQDFALHSPVMQQLYPMIAEMAEATREMLGAERLAWLESLPHRHVHDTVALVHARPENLWIAPQPDAQDAELEEVYGQLARPVAVYGHVHRPYLRQLPGMIVANSGSVGLPYDGDQRASYLLVDDAQPQIRRVAYDVRREMDALTASTLAYSDWIVKILESASPQMP